MNANNVEIAGITPVKPDTQNMGQGRDEAYGHGFNITHLENLVSDCEDQPEWRDRSDIAAGYIDGKQYTAEQEAALIAEGMKDVKPTNLVGRVVRGILGQEAKARTDVKVESDDDEIADTAEVLNISLAEAKRETFADQAVSNAYASQVGPGIGWVEVARSADVLGYPYRVKDVHRSQMWWDWRAEDVLLRDARWIVRKRWQDLDELEAAMPQHRELLRHMSNNWNGFLFDTTLEESIRLTNHFQVDQRWQGVQRRMDWFDSARKRVKMYEVWYKVPAIAISLQFSPTRRVLFDQRNPGHIQAINSGRAKVLKGPTSQVRMALYAGPHRLQDFGTNRRNFPYVPFIAYRDDEDRSPYGLVEGMISPQDEYNARRIRINWLLRARQIIMDNDALDVKANTLKDIVNSVNRPDLTVILDGNRANKNANAFRVESNLGLQKEQIDVMQDAKQNIQDVPGVYGSQLGQAASGVTSGIANSLLIEQGSVAMGDLNDNYRHSRRLVYENLLELIVEDHAQPGMQVKIGNGETRRVVVLNLWDPQQQAIVNDVKDAPVRVGLGEVPSTPAYKLQQQEQVAKIIQALAQVNPQAAAVLVPSYIEATDMPDRMERASDARRILGLPSTADKKAAAEQQEQQQQKQAQEDALKQEGQRLSLAELAAKAAKTQAEAAKTAAQVEETESKTQLNLASVAKIGHDMGLAQRQADTPQPVEAAPVPDQETPDMAHERMIEEAIQEARAARQGGAALQ